MEDLMLDRRAVQAPISVVIPCYRCKETIVRAVGSVVGQRLLPSEVILVDDGSGDGTLEVLYMLAGQFPGWIRVVEQPCNRGAAAARNRGWDLAVMEFVAFLDADDAWGAEKLAVQYAWMTAHPQVAVSAHASAVATEFGLPMAEGSTDAGFAEVAISRLLFSNFIPTRSVMLRRDIGLRFDEAFRYAEDYNLWLRCGLSGLSIAFSGRVLAYSFKADYGVGGLSQRLWRMERGELRNYRSLHQTGLIGFPVLMLASAWSLLRHCRRLLRVRLAGAG